MIETVIQVEEINQLKNKTKPERIEITRDADGRLLAISWLYETKDEGLYQMAKRRGGVWNRSAGGWTFPDDTVAENLLAAICKRNPDWPILDSSKPFLPLSGKNISRLSLSESEGIDACLFPVPLPHFTNISISGTPTPRVFRLADGKKNEVGLLIGRSEDVSTAVNSMIEQGATCDGTLAKKWIFSTAIDNKLKVKTSGWAVEVKFDLSNPFHLLAAPKQKYRWEGTHPYSKIVAIPWNGLIHTTRKLWPTILEVRFSKKKLEWEGDDPASELSLPSTFDASKVHGWATPAPNGNLLHAYQREGAEFCAKRGMRALVGDEMGVGKTVQAIAAAEATSADRVVVICPANARYVWDREIRGWGGLGEIQHITSQLDELNTSARWHIITYDLIAARTETWRLKDAQELAAFSAVCPELVKNIQIAEPGQPDQFPQKVSIGKPVDAVPSFADEKRVAAWKKTMRRLRGELLEQILAAGPVLAILDEAHRVKNKDAKRTKAIRRISESEAQVLLLTGTPLRNNEHEAAVLLSLLDVEAATTLSKERGYTIQDVKDYLEYFMIRRTKEEVLPELPEKTRQRIDISELDPDMMDAYRDSMDRARKSYYEALKSGKSEKEAHQSMQGGIEQARKALGNAKVLGGEVSDLVLDVVENKGCCVVFCAHHHASDSLKAQLEQQDLRVAVVDGRTPQKIRAASESDFQEGKLDVFIGGINAAGEAITLTRADTVIFVELDWVPAALLQAEDRIHRVGQRSNCQIIQLVARMTGENLDEMMVDLLGSKIARIGEVLDESTENIISGSIQTQIRDRILGTCPAPSSASTPTPLAVVPPPPAPSSPAGAVIAETESGGDDDEVEVPAVKAAAVKKIKAVALVGEKRNRGRPRVYVDKAPPSSAERSKQSIKALAAAGGKRVMLRLTPEAHEALRAIMSITGNQQETAAINQVIVERKNELLRASGHKTGTVQKQC